MADIAELGFSAETDALKKAKEKLDAVTDASKRTERATDRVGVSFARLAGTLTGAFAGYVSGRAVLKMAEDFTKLNNTLRIIEPNQKAVNNRIAELSAISTRTRASLTGVTQLYQRVSIAAKDLGVNSAQATQFVETVGYAMAQSSGGAAAAEGALTQLSQALGGANIQAEEFNSLLDGAYPLVLAAAQGIDEAGGSVGRLRALVVKGKISSKEFFDAIMSQSAALKTSFGQTVATIGQAFVVLYNNMMLFIGTIDQASGASAFIAQAILGIATSIQWVTANIGTFKNIFFAVLAGVATLLIASVIPAIYATVAANVALIGSFLLVNGGFMGAAAATLAWVASLTTLKAALISTGIGAIAVGVGLAVLAIMKLADKIGGLGAVWDLAKSIAMDFYNRIVAGATVAGSGISAVWITIEIAFFNVIAKMQLRWGQFLSTLASGIINIPGFEDVAATVSNAATASFNSATVGFKAIEAKTAELKATKNAVSDAIAVITTPFDYEKIKRGVVARWGTRGKEHPGMTPEEPVLPADVAAGKGGKGSAEKVLNDLQKIADAYKKLTEPFDQAKSAFDAVNSAYDAGILSTDQYTASIGKLQDAFMKAGGSAEQWGMITTNQTKTVAAQLKDLRLKGFETLGESIAELAVGGSVNFGDLAKSIIKDMIQIAVQSAIIQPLMEMFGFSLPDFKANMTPNANGNAFTGTNIIPFRKGGDFTNSVVNKRTPFSFANGTALGEMGEAGPEAIMPLKRGPDGSLGVQMHGGGGASNSNTAPAPQIVFQVINNAQNTTTRNENETQSDGTEIRRVIIETTREGMASGDFDDVNRARYGNRQQKVIR